MGAGVKSLSDSCRPMASLIPPQAKWLQTSVAEFRPDQNEVVTSDGRSLNYDYLVVALGLQVNFNKVRDLSVRDLSGQLVSYQAEICRVPRLD